MNWPSVCEHSWRWLMMRALWTSYGIGFSNAANPMVGESLATFNHPIVSSTYSTDRKSNLITSILAAVKLTEHLQKPTRFR